MDNSLNFSEFSRQSKKGILIIYLNILYKILRAAWILLFIFIQRFSKIPDGIIIYFYLGFAVFLGLILIRAYLLFKNFQFKVANNQFVLKQGILKKTNTSISFDRIQNINFKQNLVQQALDVYQVNIETAGSNKTEISIKALSLYQANALKSQLTAKENQPINEVENVEEKPFLKIKPLALLKVSLTENHLQSLLLFVALLIGLFQQLGDVFNGLGKGEVINSFIDENTSVFHENFILFIIFFILLLVTAIITSFVRVFLFHFNLTVFIKKNAFEINQGLVTKKSIILKKEKIQHITISHNPIKKKLGIYFITFKQAVSGKVSVKKDKLIKIVGCKVAQVSAIKSMLFNAGKVESFEKNWSDNYYKIRLYMWSILMLILANGIMYLSLENPYFFFVNILVLPIVIFLIELKFKKRYYTFDEELLLIGSGTIETHLTYLPFFKVQNIKFKQSYFQERKNIADVIFQTASGKITLPCLSKEKALQIFNYTLFKVETSSQSWM